MAPEYLNSPYLNPDAGRRIFKELVNHSVKDLVRPFLMGPRVLEMGYGDGLWTGEIIERFGHSDLVDMDSGLLEAAQTREGRTLTCHYSKFEDFTPENEFNTVLATYVLEHVDDPVGLLARVKSWLALDGLVIIAVPNADSLHRKLAVAMDLQKRTTDLGDTDRTCGHQRVYTLDHLRNDVLNAGLSIVNVQGAAVKPLPQRYMADLHPGLLKGFFRLGRVLPPQWCSELIIVCTH